MKKLSKARKIIVFTSLGIIALCELLLLKKQIQNFSSKRAQQDAQGMYYDSAEISVSDGVSSSSQGGVIFPAGGVLAEGAEDYEEVIPVIQEDFLELYEKNNDLVGWLKAGERIDYPVVQLDNEFYLEHDINKKANYNGTLFVNEANSLIPRDDVILIHGHNMNRGQMFGTLKKFLKFDYLSKYPVVSFRTVYDPEDVLYTPVVAFTASMDPDESDYFDVTQILFNDEQTGDDIPSLTPAGQEYDTFATYLEKILARSTWQAKTDVNENDRLLMLITCSKGPIDGRMMLVCRALRPGETRESIEKLYE